MHTYVKSIVLAASLSISMTSAAKNVETTSPDGRLVVNVAEEGGSLSYVVKYDGSEMLTKSRLGFVSEFGDFSNGLTIDSSIVSKVDNEYSLDRIKTAHVHYVANELKVYVSNKIGRYTVTFSVSNNDVAFRYEVPRQDRGERGCIRMMKESTTFNFSDKTTSFLCPQSDAMIGWKRSKPSYEEEYVLDAPLATKSKFGKGFTFPCLFRVGEQGWVLVSETGVDSRYCASHLSDYTNDGYEIAFAMQEENNGNGTAEPAFALPGVTPWRTITVGKSLAPIVETTAAWNTVRPLYTTDCKYKYGKSTWSWILWQDNSINYDDQVAFVDLAAAMGYSYTLVDCAWDTNIGRDGMKKLADYARTKGVQLFVWYSSSGYWNDIVQSPINIMDRAISRKAEMKWLKEIGAAGIKVDFFAGDKQETLRLYEDILSDANDNDLMVIFHGCTLPRGWERMYPNYVGSEAVLASENLIFEQHFCDVFGTNATLHPFVRNAVGCMEFGGCFMNKYMHRSNAKGNVRRTSDVFELATTILFQNPIQNFALAPNNLTDAPKICMDFLRNVPTTWTETRFIDGYPGKYIVLARKSADKWYVAIANGTDKEISINLANLPFADKQLVECYADSKDGKPTLAEVKYRKNAKMRVAPLSGVVYVEK
ncbi:MAG: glycoside hydrolase family 97 catalytic domain-containing protein [Bacteroidales bacterium]|nr:glycoside hydrolase family 97 catalytic domain-containing protein [Bacteroidales bacterium]